jgi:predicted transcriptional regulator
MVNRVNTLSIYIPKSKMAKRPVERLARLAKVKERSINYLVVEAILRFLDREEKKK